MSVALVSRIVFAILDDGHRSGCLQGQVSPSGGSAHAGDPLGGPVVPPRVGLGMGLFCPVGSRNAEDPLGGSVVPRLTGGDGLSEPCEFG